jgi:hypothetical protein
VHEHLTGAALDGGRGSCELRLLRPHGSSVYVQLDTSLLSDCSAVRLSVITDISASRRAREALERSNQQLEAA